MTNKSNPVGYLQEFCQRYKVAKFPDYISLPADGPDHSREFYCKCIYDGFEVIGRGNQKKQAKTDAARKMLSTLEERNYFDKLGLNVTDGSMTLNGIVPASPCNTTSKNPISALQEHCQRNSLMLPTYFDTTSMNSFICECSLNSFKTFGKASNKKMAKTESAMKMCEKLGIISNIDVLENDAKEDNMMYCHDKNAVSALQELCAQNKSWGNPVYENGEFNGQFVVVCHLGSLSAEGRDTTKKGAKLFAANNVLSKLIKQGHGSGYKIEPVQPKSKANGSMGAASLNHQQLVRNNHEELQDFNLDEEEDTEDHIKEDEIDGIKNKNEDAVPLENLVLNTIESLSLEDSVVEVEPLTTSEQQKLDGNTSNTEIYNSESDNCKRKIEEDISSESHQQGNKENSKCQVNISGTAMVYSPFSAVLDDLQDQKVTLTGIIKKDNEFVNLEALYMEIKRPVNQLCRAICQYDACNDGELTLCKGDVITLLSRDVQAEGFWKGELLGKVGEFPKICVEVITFNGSTVSEELPAKTDCVLTKRARDPVNSPLTSVFQTTAQHNPIELPPKAGQYECGQLEEDVSAQTTPVSENLMEWVKKELY
uniref:SH3 domain-containing protein n=2 Tax=Graphocephala atropunctata TaxID=36148 RepID=A0A1B6M2J9_9HEMI